MEPSKPKIACEFPEKIRLYKDGHEERHTGTEFVPTLTDPKTGVTSKDITIMGESNQSARLFLPKLDKPNQKHLLIIYFHGGSISISSPFTPRYHNYVNAIAAEANVVAVSVNSRLASENPIPAAYEDARVALQWVGSHSGNVAGPEAGLNEHADLERVFLGGVLSVMHRRFL